jgi:hypothetical protein
MTPGYSLIDALKDEAILADLWRERALERAYQLRQAARRRVRCSCENQVQKIDDRVAALERACGVASWWADQVLDAMVKVSSLRAAAVLH